MQTYGSGSTKIALELGIVWLAGFVFLARLKFVVFFVQSFIGCV